MKIEFDENVVEIRYDISGVKIAVIKKNNLYIMYIDDLCYFMDLYRNNPKNYFIWRKTLNEIRINMKLHDNKQTLNVIEFDINTIINLINKLNEE